MSINELFFIFDGYIELFFLYFFRLAPISFLPFVIPLRAGILLRIVISAALSVFFVFTFPDFDRSTINIWSYVGEFFTGALIYILINAVFMIWLSLGYYADTLRGGSNALISGITGNSNILGNFYLLLGIVLFFAYGGHIVFMEGLAQTFVLIPPGSADLSLLFSRSFTVIIKIMSLLFIITFVLSLPLIITIFMIDLTFGAISRFYPSVNSYFISLPLKNIAVIYIILLIYFLLGKLNIYLTHLIFEIIINM